MLDEYSIEWLPSLLAANILNLEKELKKIEQAGLACVHIDVMDGHFVKNISFGPAIVAAVKKAAPKLFRDVHLMITHPPAFVAEFIRQGAQRIFIHIELPEIVLQKSIALLQSSGVEWGFAINPETPLEKLQIYETMLPKISRLLVMSVYPGFAGQAFLKFTYKRIEAIRNNFPDLPLCIDGGINAIIAQNLRLLGVNCFVMGASFFSQIKELNE